MKRFLLRALLAVVPFVSSTEIIAQSDDAILAYPDVVIVPIDAFRENRNTTRDDAPEIRSAIWRTCIKENEEANAKDWNTLRDNPNLDLQGIRYFLTYSYHYNPETGGCSVTISVYPGPSYNPDAGRPLQSFSGYARGASGPDAARSDSGAASDCLEAAAQDAAKQLCGSELFSEGWSDRPLDDADR